MSNPFLSFVLQYTNIQLVATEYRSTVEKYSIVVYFRVA